MTPPCAATSSVVIVVMARSMAPPAMPTAQATSPTTAACVPPHIVVPLHRRGAPGAAPALGSRLSRTRCVAVATPFPPPVAVLAASRCRRHQEGGESHSRCNKAAIHLRINIAVATTTSAALGRLPCRTSRRPSHLRNGEARRSWQPVAARGRCTEEAPRKTDLIASHVA